MHRLNPFSWEEAHYHRYGIPVLVFIGLVLLLPGTFSLPLLDRDEPRFAEATLEMMDRGSWAIPYFNNEYRFDKPPLIYWWMAPHYAILGKTELAARLPGIEATLLTALAIFAFGRRLLNARTAFWAAAAYLTCFQVWIHGRLALADMPMILSVVLTHWATWELFQNAGETDRSQRKWRWFLWLSHTFGFYAKGPIVLFCWCLTLLLYRFAFRRRPLPWKSLGFSWGIPLFLVLLALWGIPALILTEGAFWDIGMGKHVVDRGLDSFNERFSLPFFYLITAFISLFPWMARLGHAIRFNRQNWDAKSAFLLSWACGPFLIFSFYATQLPHYTLPAFPALLLLLMRSSSERADSTRFFWGYVGFWTLLVLSLAGILYWIEWPEITRGVVPALFAVLALFVAYLAMLLAFERKRFTTWMISLLMLGAGSWAVGHTFRAISPVVVMSDFFQKQPADMAFAAEGFTEPSLVWYSGRFWNMNPEEGLDAWLADTTGPRLALRLHREWPLDRFLKPQYPGREGDPLSIFQPRRSLPLLSSPSDSRRIFIQGMNFARFSWTELEVVIVDR